MTPHGNIAIEKIAPGDIVYSVDPATYELAARKVLQAHRHPVKKILLVELANHTLLGVTPNHPFYNPASRTYRPAGKLNAGDRVVALTAGSQEETSVIAIHLLPEGQTEVYNLTMDGEFSNYVAGGILVHNTRTN